MKKRTKTKHRTGTSRVKAIPSTEPAARDEGPRLLPLHSEDEEVPMKYYLQLADAALGTAAKPAKEKKSSPEKNDEPETPDSA